MRILCSKKKKKKKKNTKPSLHLFVIGTIYETCSKLTNKDTRATAFWCLCSWIWTDFIYCSGITNVYFEQLNVDRISIAILLSNRTVLLENTNNINIILLRNIFGRIKSLHKKL